jgi:hypothetical protein
MECIQSSLSSPVGKHDKIDTNINGTDDDDDDDDDDDTENNPICMFSHLKHVISIEPNNSHLGNNEKGKPAFFSDHEEQDPTLNRFTCFLLSAEINNCNASTTANAASAAAATTTTTTSMPCDVTEPMTHPKVDGNDNTLSNNSNNNHHTSSPATSSMSTFMSTPLGNKLHYHRGDTVRLENSSNSNMMDDDKEEDDEDDEVEPIFKTHLMYFVFSKYSTTKEEKNECNSKHETKIHDFNEVFEIYFVDYLKLQSLEIVTSKSSSPSPPSSTSSSKVCHWYKPMSLLFKFEACTFRIFGIDFCRCPHWDKGQSSTTPPPSQGKENDDNNVTNYENHLRNSFDAIKKCINTYNENLQVIKYHFMYMTDLNATSHTPSHHSMAPDTIPPPSIYTYVSYFDDPLQDEQHTAENSKNIEGNSGKRCTQRKRKLQSYDKSWTSLERIHNFIDSESSLDENNMRKKKYIISLAERSTIELGKSYVVDDHMKILQNDHSIFTSREQCSEVSNIADLQLSVDNKIQRIFALSSKKRKDECRVSEEEIKRDLNKLREAVSETHKLMFLPSL